MGKTKRILLFILLVIFFVGMVVLIIRLATFDNKKEYFVTNLYTEVHTYEYGGSQDVCLYVEYYNGESYIELNKSLSKCTELEKYIIENQENYKFGSVKVIIHDYVAARPFAKPQKFGNFELFIVEGK